MKKFKFLRIFFSIVLILSTMVDLSFKNSYYDMDYEIYMAGFNGKHIKEIGKLLKKGWSSVKSCSRKQPSQAKKLLVTSNIINRSLTDIKAEEEILPKIEEYLSRSEKPSKNIKIIDCLKTDANEIRMSLYEQGSVLNVHNKIIRASADIINLAEYDIMAMQEIFYSDINGVEYVQFIIPRIPKYILDGKYSDRIYECMVFNIPKDINGNWKKIKEYIQRFIFDILNSPSQLWDEYQFRRGLKEFCLDSRDIQEIKRYKFAKSIFKDINNGTFSYIQEEIA